MFHDADPLLLAFFGGIGAVLVVSSVIAWILGRRAKDDAARATISNLKSRIFAWWVMIGVVAVATAIPRYGVIVLFALISFHALREFVTITPTKRSDHRSLFWVFFVILPVNYILIAMPWYGMWSIFVPVYGFLFIPIRSALAGESEDFLGRTARAQWGAMITIYCISHAPALLILEIPGYEHPNVLLLLFFLLVVQMSDVLQYVWGKSLGKHKIAPKLSPSKTVEGFVGGVLSVTAIGALLHFATPFTPIQAGAISLLVALMGFAGGLVMSAVKRDIGIKDYGNLIPGHGGMLDRLDSVIFSAPIFFHVVRYYFTP
jgi:phosphatidate cytidylyltransferase